MILEIPDFESPSNNVSNIGDILRETVTPESIPAELKSRLRGLEVRP